MFSTPQQQQPQSLFQSQPQLFQQSSPLFPQQQQPQFPQQYQQPFLQQQQPQQQQQQQQKSYLFTNDKAPASYSTKWADLHPDSQKILLQIEYVCFGNSFFEFSVSGLMLALEMLFWVLTFWFNFFARKQYI